MASQTLTIKLDGFLQLREGVNRGIAVLQKPFAGQRGRDSLRAVRTGKNPGSVQAQFRSGTYIGLSGSRAWKKTRAFFDKPEPKATMVRKGTYQKAWIGQGFYSYDKIEDNRITWGVKEQFFGQAKIHQGNAPFKIKANAFSRTKGGHLKMQIKLYYLTGKWFGEDYLLNHGFVIEPRKVGLNQHMAKAVIDVLQKAFDKAVKKGGSK